MQCRRRGRDSTPNLASPEGWRLPAPSGRNLETQTLDHSPDVAGCIDRLIHVPDLRSTPRIAAVRVSVSASRRSIGQRRAGSSPRSRSVATGLRPNWSDRRP